MSEKNKLLEKIHELERENERLQHHYGVKINELEKKLEEMRKARDFHSANSGERMRIIEKLNEQVARLTAPVSEGEYKLALRAFFSFIDKNGGNGSYEESLFAMAAAIGSFIAARASAEPASTKERL